MRWKHLPFPASGDNEVALTWARLNSLGSLFFFISYTLGKTRLRALHRQMCASLETEDLHLVLEEPVGHFKSTVGAEGLSMWWSLPFTPRDEFLMRELGYGDEWIRWMRIAHNPNTRTLVAHEVESRAIAMGKAIDHHYLENDTFRSVFPEIIPDGNCTWNDHSKFQRRVSSERNDPTTGTYEYRGVGQAIQGIHVDSTIQDDNVGKAAQTSLLNGDGRVMEDTIRWHRQLGTRIDSAAFTRTGLGRQLVIGNRWAHNDLNSWIRENQPEFKFETHSAEGGCCALHPAGQPIFPEEWTMERLATERATLGNYDYAHQYLNMSVLPEECIFRPEWLRYYRFKPSEPGLSLDDPRNILLLEHEVYEGKAAGDIAAGQLTLRMVVDLAHAKKRKRCNHVIVVVGLDADTDNFYLLDVWAKPSPYSELCDMMYVKGRKWGLREVWLETVAAQNILKFYLEERNARESHPLYVNELAYDNSENAKKNRIEALEPIFRNGQFWCHRTHTEFLNEYNAYPAGRTVDVLDALGYAPQTFERIRRRELMQHIAQQNLQFRQRVVSMTGY
jgi:hypothetical protein